MNKFVLGVFLSVLSVSAMASEYTDVRCKDPFEGLVIFDGSKVKRASTTHYGTSIHMTDGTSIQYSPTIECRITVKD